MQIDHFLQIETVPYVGFVNAWTVEAIDAEGAVEIAIFDGPRALERAGLYREALYVQPLTSK
jgi:hypothetical protein